MSWRTACNATGELLTETHTAGPLSGLTVALGYDAALRRNALALNSQPATLNLAYTHDPAGRLQTVSDGAHTATYDYLENSPLVSQITFATGGQTVMTTSKQHDFLDRLTAIASHPGGTPSPASVSFAYGYNSANQRIRRTESDSSYWVYQYDAFGQVTSGKRYWADGTPARPVRYYERIRLCLRLAESEGRPALRRLDERFAAEISRTSGRAGGFDAGSRTV